MADREAIVCFGGYDYWYSNPGSPVQLMEAAHRAGHKVLWVNSIGMNMPRMRKSGFWRRVGLKLRSWSRWLKAANTDFHVLSPIILPLFGSPALERMNEHWLAFQVKLAYRILGLKRPMVMVCLPSFAKVATTLPNAGLIYYLTDKFEAYRDLKARDSMLARDRLLKEMSDLLLCSSRKIQEDASTYGDKARHFPHAVDSTDYDAALASNAPEPADLAAIAHPRVGYFGSLTNANNLDLIEYCAKEDPRLQFVLIGRVMGDYSQVDSLPNVHLLGMKPYDEIPFYGKGFDVGIMTWRLTEWICYCSPIKTKEYLALGLPVVSIPIEEHDTEFPGLVETIETGPQMLAAIQRSLASDNDEKRAARRQRVKGESWDRSFGEMIAMLKERQSGH